MAIATSSVVLELAAKELTTVTAQHPFLFELGPIEGRKALDEVQSAPRSPSPGSTRSGSPSQAGRPGR